MKIFINMYNYIRNHHLAGWFFFIVITAVFLLSALTLSYKEDISDFLPLDEHNKRQLELYQETSGAGKLFAIVSSSNGEDVSPDSIVAAIEAFCTKIESRDSMNYMSSVTSQIDIEKITDVSDFIYDNVPLFLEQGDYEKIDSLLSSDDFIDRKIREDKEILMLPSSSMMINNISADPLSLFSSVFNGIASKESGINYETYDNFIFSPDGSRGIVILESSAGARESGTNKELIGFLEKIKGETEGEFSNIAIHIIGGPAIAVANASRIKKDGLSAGIIAGILILILLIYVFRNVRNIFLIFFSVGWGMLFALGCLGFYYDSVSVIVLGISSVIVGLALNYPLHLIDHLKGSRDKEASMKEVITPLVVGNVTTVGAFLCLIPLNSVALHDLGLFSSFLLVGTILFVLIFLPHAVRTGRSGKHINREPRVLTVLSNYSPERNSVAVWTVVVLTIVFSIFCGSTEFDSDMRNINYMTPEQQKDMDYFRTLASQEKGMETIYLVADGKNGDEAFEVNRKLENYIDSLSIGKGMSSMALLSRYLPDSLEQVRRLARWEEFISQKGDILLNGVRKSAVGNGFNEDAFVPFENILCAEYIPLNSSDFKPLTTSVFARNISVDSLAGKYSVINTLDVPVEKVAEVKESLKGTREFGADFFDVKSLNGSIADTLSDDFNYIGFVCGGIVFIFLWISLGRLELAVISFLPMAVSWIWILGIMGMTGINFNIVNLILATFIFGQGDDYTIFMTEGLIYEYAYRKKILASYKNSIIVSALIMFIGIGALIFSKHPAMRSLGEVTVVGMLSVVLMAYLFPPLIFNFLVKKNGKFRKYPITLRTLFKGTKGLDDISRVMGRYIYKGAEVERNARKCLKEIREDKDEKSLPPLLKKMHEESSVVIDARENQGEIALLMALRYPDTDFMAVVADEDHKKLLEGCADGFVNNLTVSL